jgi:prepilin-type N-terminal cleavage/methylation domain-containing protein/prepilin-type processing-associated H-X9-DG protein
MIHFHSYRPLRNGSRNRCNNRAQGAAGSRGFTLVELMVTIGIIAVLAALLFPVMRSVRDRGKMAVCSNNLKQLGLAFQQYLQDYQQRYPGAGQFQKWGNGGHWVAGTNGSVSGGEATGGSLFKLVTPEEPAGPVADVQHGALYPYVKNAQVYVCPSTTYADFTGLSYSMNCAVAGLNATVRMKHPDQINLLVDEAYANDGFFYADDAAGSTDSLATNHLNSGNILFCDGHIKSYTFEMYPLGKNTIPGNGALKVKTSETPRFWDVSFTTDQAQAVKGYYHSDAFGDCKAP